MENQKTKRISKTSIFLIGVALIVVYFILSDWEHFKQGLLGI
ncbi:hypothetical protein [Salegentibacter sp. Hel_I_6]|nr:hypothetical protein [Salegentibacter sp. Hel_I_6]